MDFQQARTQGARRRILLIHTGMSYGGVDVYLANLARLLNREVDLLLFCCNRQVQEQLGNLGVTPFEFSRLAASRSLQVGLFLLALPFFVMNHSIDTIWVQGGIGTVFLPAARILGCRAILTRHGTLTLERLNLIRSVRHRIVEWMVLKFAQCANTVICVSENVADDLRQFLPESKLQVIPNWVPVPIQSSLPRPKPRGPLSLLFVGRLERFKGIDLVIDALRRLNATGNATTLTIVGEGSYRSALERKAKGTSAVFAGFQPRPARFYEAADIFINPSENEGFPLTSLEAMSYGVACVFSDIPPHREIAGGDRSALLFRNGDAEDLFERLHLCVSDRDLLSRLGERARRAVAARFNPDAAYHSYANVLQLAQSNHNNSHS